MAHSGRALVTGGTGFIGSHVCEALLHQGWRVTIVDRFSENYPRELKQANIADAISLGASLIEADITDVPAMERTFDRVMPDLVVHLAAEVGVRPSIKNPIKYAHVNVTGTQIVLDQSVRIGVSRFIVASSSSVYGNSEDAPFHEEQDVSKPISPYAATKIATELLCRTAAAVHDLPITALRFFTVYGPCQRPDLAIEKFMTCIMNGEPIPMYGDGGMARDFTFIDDIVDGVLRAIDRCGEVAPYRVYNLGSDRPIVLRDLIRAVESVSGQAVRIEQHPHPTGDVSRTWADLTRSRRELGYTPATSLEAGLQRQWAWIQKRAETAVL